MSENKAPVSEVPVTKAPDTRVPVTIDTPLLIVGGGPAALIVGTVASGYSLSSLIVGHESKDSDELFELDDKAIALLKPHGVINVLRPYAESYEPFVITAALFEKVLKHHCVVNMNITLYDGMELLDLSPVDVGAKGTISDGETQWLIKAGRIVDTTKLSANLNAAIKEGAAIAKDIVNDLLEQP
jgi:hypothetical protein